MKREGVPSLTADQEAELQHILQEIDRDFLSDGRINLQKARAIVQLSQQLAPVQAEVLYRIRQAIRERWGDRLDVEFED
ncbi:hypothetical protein [Synechococcus elongatus]|uniref:Uncharacterized protein n=1 Tax=Synechococcus elongatus (strain ATCC 33912 / PCC 7942 / FACHB-805) TaxID=1140 RepID=Q31QR4_SYNE7|nr:hypothetical protein [Synechococcus elongatus]ABB56605.1 hypothetical protein Synpcc7942_0573 [Synechococcus elongatus PCC 7942 = FACHB-805]AJD58835.1 hypothetical protein M744_00070 [Synechococcus elongatus UTEX 2973]MBD2588812.1 hypothetical protein [Synechococcus elongatus FACHB-242]MBD2689878.1 hypothetical protein [Synechococcus elongatus FACHB-1061]MBD2706849.1 hypothetical protein [Synechococcus elongatus PCC 7942 = FACHB-805]